MNVDPDEQPARADDPEANDPSDILATFVGRLRARFAGTDEKRAAELCLAEAGLRYRRGGDDPGGLRPAQLAVLGPTQTGKSTVVNLLLGVEAARTSPLAGFTVHPQAFVCGGRTRAGDLPKLPTGANPSCSEFPGSSASAPGDDAATATAGVAPPPIVPPWVAQILPNWPRCLPGQLDRAKIECYSLIDMPAAEFPDRASDQESRRESSRGPDRAESRECVVWDTPDFDSVSARTYQRGLLEIAALADLHLLVLSKEKYSDLTVWQLARLLRPFGRPLAIVLNKITPDAAETIRASLRERLRDAGYDADATPIVTLPYCPELKPGVDERLEPTARRLRTEISARLAPAANGAQSAGVREFLRAHWAGWTAPVREELAVIDAWHAQVDKELEHALDTYERDFLNHPQRFDTFRRATVQLLDLLELPGFAGVLGQVRQTLTWPARQLFAARKGWLRRRKTKDGVPHGLGSEEVVLFEVIDKLLTDLERDAARKADPGSPGAPVWSALARQVGARREALSEQFRSAARRQRESFEPVVQAAANRLYEILQDRPVMLNTLRAARATTDAAGIALAIKTGGLGVNDLLFAPAMLALTSMLTEGALGTYMVAVADDLKKQQRRHVRDELLQGQIQPHMHSLATDLEDAALFGVTGDEMVEADVALENWKAEGG